LWSVPMKMMSSGMTVFFIQKLGTSAGTRGKIIPSSGPRAVRNINPRACSSSVLATSTRKLCLPRRLSTVSGMIGRPEIG
jgi:hypothetical protein